ncbi:multidrug efflux SMR transporter [uncultured Tateyamaria sp.]|uniref:DMT family transporter n=1 Tax=uncultured Tateyamaria sp. TaxID=455651 RepID=UPI00260CCF0A|nr:multidrug efflux SMR transporter [uncultured Tateyamaria sp.]
MAWFYLGLAAVFEVTFAMSMKYSEGFTNLRASLITAVAVIAGIGFLTLALRDLPVSVAYPIWTAVGTLGTVALGYVFLGEALTPLKMLSALAIVAGVAGLKISAG